MVKTTQTALWASQDSINKREVILCTEDDNADVYITYSVTPEDARKLADELYAAADAAEAAPSSVDR